MKGGPNPEYLWGYHKEVDGPKASKQSAGRLVNLGKDRPEVLRIGGPERAASAHLRKHINTVIKEITGVRIDVAPTDTN